MKRKEFMQQEGATCSNWNFSWSFKNEKTKTVYFGAWDNEHVFGIGTKIFSLDWEFKINSRGKAVRNKGYRESEQNIDLILTGKYKLKTFPMFRALGEEIKIGRIVPEATEQFILCRGDDYFASPTPAASDGGDPKSKIYMEGAKRQILQTLRERSPDARRKCLEHFGYSCRVCDFDFEKKYGDIGKGYIHVHHLELIAKKDGEHAVDPFQGLRPLCPNCHAMVHKKNPPISINKMRAIIGKESLESQE